MSFAIANNLLAHNTKATDLGISPQTIMAVAWNNSENLKDGSSSMKHLEICSYTILEKPPKNKWGAWLTFGRIETSYLEQKCVQANSQN